MAASIKGRAHSGTSGGQRISAIMEGKGSSGILPLYKEESGFKEQSSSEASFWKQSSEDSIFFVCSLASKYLNTLGGFSPFLSCCFLALAFILFLFLSYFSGGGCCPIVTLGTSLNFAGQGGGNYCLTTISSGIGGSSACSVLSMEGMLNCRGYRLASWSCLFFKSSNGLYSSQDQLSLSLLQRSCSTILQQTLRWLRKGLLMLGNSFFLIRSSLFLMKRQEVKNLVRTQSNTFLALSISLLVSTAILEIIYINSNRRSPGSPSLLIYALSKSLEQQSTKKCLQQNQFSLELTAGTTRDNISSTCSMLIRCGRISASFKNLINETAVIFLFWSSTSLWLSNNLPCLLRVQQFSSTQMRQRFLNSFQKLQMVFMAFSIIIFLLTSSMIMMRGQVIDSLSAKLFYPNKSLQTLSCWFLSLWYKCLPSSFNKKINSCLFIVRSSIRVGVVDAVYKACRFSVAAKNKLQK